MLARCRLKRIRKRDEGQRRETRLDGRHREKPGSRLQWRSEALDRRRSFVPFSTSRCCANVASIRCIDGKTLLVSQKNKMLVTEERIHRGMIV